MAQKKNAAAVALGRKGGLKGGRARAAKMTPEQRSESARKAVQARWTKATTDNVHKRKEIGTKQINEFYKTESTEAAAAPVLDTSKKALHLCLKRLKIATDQTEIERLTEELHRIVFHKQYQNAEN